MKKKTIFALGAVLCVMFLLCACKQQEYGTFMDLEVAYTDGILSKEDIRSIADKYNNKLYETMQEEDALELKKAYAARYPREKFSYQDVTIDAYYGKYAHCMAVIIRYSDTYSVPEINTVVIADTEIHYIKDEKIAIYTV